MIVHTKTYLIYVLLSLSACIISCGGGSAAADGDKVPADSGAFLTPEEKRIKDSLDSIAAIPAYILRDSIHSPEEAQSFMRESGYWQAFSAGVIDTIAKQNLRYAEKLLRNREDYFIVADKQRMKVVLYDRFGRPKGAYRMACSAKFGTKHARRDNRTPEGYFTAEGVHNSTEWLYTDDDGNTSEKRGQFGPRFIRIKEAPMIGIHGTCAPWSRGHRSSHGCIRLHNAHILELVGFVTPGTPIIISPSDRDQRVNREEGYTRITQLHLPDVPENPVNEDIPGLKEYEEREKLIQHRKDSIAAVMREREYRRRIADSLANSCAKSNDSVSVVVDTVFD